MTGNERRIEELDTVGRPTPVPASGVRARFSARGLSFPAVAVGALLVATLVLGANGMRPASDGTTPAQDPAAGQPATADGGTGSDADGGVMGNLGGEDGDGALPGEVKTDPGTEEPTEEPTKEPEPEPTDPAVVKVNLDAAERDGKVRLEWGACEAPDVAYWKVVRSGDEAAKWPFGSKDTLLAALDPTASAYTDGKAPDGRKSWYRVFAVASVEGEYVVRCASGVERVFVTGPDPTAKPTPEPTAKPEVGSLELAVKLKDGHPYLDWSGCKADGFDYYKVVASKDGTVRWPTGDNDWLVAAISERDVTALWDKEAPAGKALWYRVFCVRASDDGYKTLAVSDARKVVTPEVDPGPRPEPVDLGIETGVEGGAVWLDWESCGSDAFVYYKVVRSHNDNPSYLPWTDGTELIGVIENPGASAIEDHDVASGDVWFYRIQAIGRWNGEKILLGETRVVRVEIP